MANKDATIIEVYPLESDADYTLLTLGQISSADFYMRGQATNEAFVKVHMADGNTYTVQGQQAFFLEAALKRQGEAPQRPGY